MQVVDGVIVPLPRDKGWRRTGSGREVLKLPSGVGRCSQGTPCHLRGERGVLVLLGPLGGWAGLGRPAVLKMKHRGHSKDPTETTQSRKILPLIRPLRFHSRDDACKLMDTVKLVSRIRQQRESTPLKAFL